jgi:hypothetical protein
MTMQHRESAAADRVPEKYKREVILGFLFPQRLCTLVRAHLSNT